MGESETEAGSTAMLRRLRALIGDGEDAGGATDWRADLRLFVLTWAAGFLFFMVVFA